MGDEDTPRSASKLTIEDFIVREMRTGFRDVYTRLDDYRGEAKQSNADLKAHIATCDRRYGEMLATRSDGQTNKMPRRDWLVEKLKEKLIDYGILTVIVFIIYAFTHGAKLPGIG